MSKSIPDAEDLAFLNHEARHKMLFARDRCMDRVHEPYSVEQFKNHFAPYLLLMDHEGLSPREVRLIETILWAWGEIIEGRHANRPD